MSIVTYSLHLVNVFNVFLLLDTEFKSLISLVVEEDVGEVELYPQQQVVGELAWTQAVTRAH